MVKRQSTARFSSIDMPVILAQTDTTVGFLSLNAQRLYEIKSRPNEKPFIKVYKDLASFKSDSKRVFKNRRSLVRRAKRTTFIINDFSFRIANPISDSQILKKTPWFYSTSANKSGQSFQREFCESKADIIIENIDSLKEKESSSIIRLNRVKRRRVR